MDEALINKSVLISELSNYNLPRFVLQKIAEKCGSQLSLKGKITTVLDSMNEDALRLLHKIFVRCEEDEEGEFSDYRFAVFISTMVHSNIMFDQSITGQSGTTYKVMIAAFNDEGLIAIGQNKSNGERVSLDELTEFNEMVKDIAKSDTHGHLTHAFYGSSTGYTENFKKAFVGNRETKTRFNKYGYKIPKTILLLEFVNKNTNRVFSTSF